MSDSRKAAARILAGVGLSLTLAACAAGNQAAQEDANAPISFWHDDNRSVSCWIYHNGYQGGLSCIPDDQLEVHE